MDQHTAQAVPTTTFGSRLITPARRRALYHGLVLAGWLFVFLNIPKFVDGGLWGRDAIAYWSVDLGNPYRGQLDQYGYFPYAPPAALVASLFKLVPWPIFLVGWTAMLLAVLAWIGGGLRSLVVLLAIPPVFLEVLYGNIHILLAAAVVAGFRWSGAWSFVLLTKVTPALGMAWFLVRREWRPLLIVAGVTAAISAASAVIAPGLWPQWIGSLVSSQTVEVPWGHAIVIPLLIRLPIALALVLWGARTDRPWTVAVAATLALPVLWTAGLSMLVGVVALRRRRYANSTVERRAVESRRLGDTGRPAVARAEIARQ